MDENEHFKNNYSYYVRVSKKRTHNKAAKVLIKPFIEKESRIAGQKIKVIEIPVSVKEMEAHKKCYQRIIRWKLRKYRKRSKIFFQQEGKGFAGGSPIGFPPEVVEECLKLFLKEYCVFRKHTKVIIVDNGYIDITDIIMNLCGRLNHLVLIVKETEDYEYLLEEIYEESGLVAFATGNLSQVDEGDILIDVQREIDIPVQRVKKGCLYFDGMGDMQKERLFQVKRKDVTYVTCANYLDRTLRNTL